MRKISFFIAVVLTLSIPVMARATMSDSINRLRDVLVSRHLPGRTLAIDVGAEGTPAYVVMNKIRADAVASGEGAAWAQDSGKVSSTAPEWVEGVYCQEDISVGEIRYVFVR